MSGSSTLPPTDPQGGGSLVDAAKEGYAARRSALEAEDGRSLGEMLSAVTTNVSTLMQQEMALAKAELKQSGMRAGKGIGLFAGAAVGGVLFLVFLSVSAWWGLGQLIENQWSALVVAAIWAIVAGVLAMVGKKEFDRIRGIPQTTETLSKVPNALKGHEEENR
ncbi:MAG TPA: phage holin family protein [Microlunatus sp.]